MTIKEWHQLIEEKFVNAGFSNASLEAKWLIASALEKEPSFLILHPTYHLTSQEEDKLHDWLIRRLQEEPLSRLKGVREFWSLPFHLNEHTLDPRPETELLVEGVLKWVGKRTAEPWRILDLGTGSGCLLISLLHELKNATGVGIDLSEGALTMARSNATLNKVPERATFCQGNWVKGVLGLFDIIISNPPYIPLNHKTTLAKAVLHFDPSLALFGGEDGLECYRSLAENVAPLLAQRGLIGLELGYDQRKDVEELFYKVGFETLFILKDLGGIERVIGMQKISHA